MSSKTKGVHCCMAGPLFSSYRQLRPVTVAMTWKFGSYVCKSCIQIAAYYIYVCVCVVAEQNGTAAYSLAMHAWFSIRLMLGWLLESV